jgi:hypothetical protein
MHLSRSVTARPRPGRDTEALPAVFEFAAGCDATLHATARERRRLASREVRPVRYLRSALFDAMAAGRISLFSGLQLPVGVGRGDVSGVLSDAARMCLSKQRVSAMHGPKALRRRIPVERLLDRWQRDDGIVSITDLHIRQTPLEQLIGIHAISDFNMLPFGSDAVAWHEMMTMVFSSKGAVTDSHCDDPDGSNHCFAGRKLWFAWDTFEGHRAGLQDVERHEVNGSATFSIGQFLEVPSARWFVVSPGTTLFLPGNYTHIR